MRLVFIGNCQAKALSEYFIHANESIPSFDSIYFKYVLDDVATWDMSQIEEADVLIYQDVTVETLHSDSNETMKERYIPKRIAHRLKKKGKLCISFPSIYFSAYFPDPLSSTESRQHFINDLPKECFPNWTLPRKFIQTVCSEKSIKAKVDSIVDPSFIDLRTLEAGWEKTYNNLKSREIANQVDIPMADWMQKNWRMKRLMHITNHPTRFTLQYLMDRILDIFEHHSLRYPPILRTLVMTTKDTMIASGRVPILPCVLQHCAEDFEDNDKSFAWINGAKINTWEEYVSFYAQRRAS